MDPALLLVAGLAVILVLQFTRVRRQQREVRATQSALDVGAEVLTASGMVGTVVESSGATVVLAGEDGHRTRWVTGAVIRVLADTDPVSSRFRAADAGTAAPSDAAPPDAARPGVVDLDKGPRDAPDTRGDDATGSTSKD